MVWKSGVSTYVGGTLRGVVSGGECRSTGSVLVISNVLDCRISNETYSVDEALSVLSLSLVADIVTVCWLSVVDMMEV
jgi:hypothetical protein